MNPANPTNPAIEASLLEAGLAGGDVRTRLDGRDKLMVITDRELLYVDPSGLQRASLREVSRVVSEKTGALTVSAPAGPLIRGSVRGFDITELKFFFEAVKVATARAKTGPADPPPDEPVSPPEPAPPVQRIVVGPARSEELPPAEPARPADPWDDLPALAGPALLAAPALLPADEPAADLSRRTVEEPIPWDGLDVGPADPFAGPTADPFAAPPASPASLEPWDAPADVTRASSDAWGAPVPLDPPTEGASTPARPADEPLTVTPVPPSGGNPPADATSVWASEAMDPRSSLETNPPRPVSPGPGFGGGLVDGLTPMTGEGADLAAVANRLRLLAILAGLVGIAGAAVTYQGWSGMGDTASMILIAVWVLAGAVSAMLALAVAAVANTVARVATDLRALRRATTGQ